MAKFSWRKLWHFLWYEDSVESWVVSILVSFILIKFVVYPLLGLLFGTSFPVVAVVSNSMEHNHPFDEWWASQEDLYLRYNITKYRFEEYPLKTGFNKGDIIFLVGVAPERVNLGDVIVFWGDQPYPIIHRVVAVNYDEHGWSYSTKGDNNLGQIIKPGFDERRVPYEVRCRNGVCPRHPAASCGEEVCRVVLGKAVLRLPFLGWVKIGFVDLLNALGLRVV